MKVLMSYEMHEQETSPERADSKIVSGKERYDYYLLHKERFDAICKKFKYTETDRSSTETPIGAKCVRNFKERKAYVQANPDVHMNAITFHGGEIVKQFIAGVEHIGLEFTETKEVNDVFSDVVVLDDDERYGMTIKVGGFGTPLFPISKLSHIKPETISEYISLRLIIDIPPKPILVFESYSYRYGSNESVDSIGQQFELIYVKEKGSPRIEQRIIVQSKNYKNGKFADYIKYLESFAGHKKGQKYDCMTAQELESYKLRYK